MSRILLQIILFLMTSTFIQSVFGQQTVQIKTHFVDDSFDSLSLVRLNEAVALLEEALSSDEFKSLVRDENFNVGNNELSSEEILNLILGGNDNYIGAESDSILDFRIGLFSAQRNRSGDNFGVTDMTTRITRTHRCYVWNNDVKCYASHLMHEYMHQIGFYDERRYGIFGTKTHSVPYRINDIIDRIIQTPTTCTAQQNTCNSDSE